MNYHSKGDEEKLNPGHSDVRSVLRIAGPFVLFAGLVFVAVGMISFFSSFGSFEPPRHFWCTFVVDASKWQDQETARERNDASRG